MTSDATVLDAFKREAHTLIRDAVAEHPSDRAHVTVMIHPDRYAAVLRAIEPEDRAVTYDAAPGVIGLRVWGMPVVKRAHVPVDGMQVRHAKRPRPRQPEPTLDDCWRQPVPLALLLDEPMRRTFIDRQVREQARWQGYHGRVRFAVMQPSQVGSELLGLTATYWIEVMR